MWGPEWDMWEYFGFRSDVDPPYDNMGNHLFFGEYPNGKWRSSWLNRFDDLYSCEMWHTYGFEWTAEEARWVYHEKYTGPEFNLCMWFGEICYCFC